MSEFMFTSPAALLMKATIVVGAGLAVHLCLRCASAATRHLICASTLLGLLALPLLSMGLPVWSLGVLSPEEAPAASAPAIPAPTYGVSRVSGFESSLVDVSQAASLTSASPPLAGSGGFELQFPTWSPTTWFGLIWFIGIAFFLGRIVTGLLRMRWLVGRGRPVEDPETLAMLEESARELGLKQMPRLIRSARVEVPVVWGWRRPTLVVPRTFRTWSLDRRRVVLLHELGHLKRSDWSILVLGRVVTSLFWFHPGVLYLEHTARRECERACDDLVVESGTRPSDYAAHLLSIARRLPDLPDRTEAALALFRRSHLESRLRSILNPLLRRSAPSRRMLALTIAALVVVVLPISAVRLAPREVPSEEPAILLAQNSGDRSFGEKIHKKVERMIQGDDDEGLESFERGYELHGEGNYVAAREAFEEAIEHDFRPATAMYNIACGYSLGGDQAQAMEWLERSFAAGMDDPAILAEDSDLDPMRASEDFQRFMDAAFAEAGVKRRKDEHYPRKSTMDRLRMLRETDSADGDEWTEIGTQLLFMREFDAAIDALGRAVEHGGGTTPMYNLACTHSLAGNTGRALEWLERAVDAGFDQHERFVNDADLDPLRNSPAFARIAEISETLSLEQFSRRTWDLSNYSEKRWAPAVELYSEFVRDYPDKGRGWFNLGYALHYSSRHEEAIDALSRAEGLGFRPATAAYNVACAHAMLDHRSEAIEWLERAVDHGFSSYGHMEDDDDLDNLRSEARFQRLLKDLEKRHEAKQAMKKKHKEHKEKHKHIH